MADRPILFSTPMIRAILDERKTQTRRVIHPQPVTPFSTFAGFILDEPHRMIKKHGVVDLGAERRIRLPARPGERLWVREGWHTGQAYDDLKPSELGGDEQLLFTADGARLRWHDACSKPGRYRSGRFMPRWASRITLRVTDVRVQRLQEISASDAEAEGVFRHIALYSLDKVYRGARAETAIAYFRDIWSKIHGPDAWEQNPWVAAISFTPVFANIDAVQP